MNRKRYIFVGALVLGVIGAEALALYFPQGSPWTPFEQLETHESVLRTLRGTIWYTLSETEELPSYLYTYDAWRRASGTHDVKDEYGCPLTLGPLSASDAGIVLTARCDAMATLSIYRWEGGRAHLSQARSIPLPASPTRVSSADGTLFAVADQAARTVRIYESAASTTPVRELPAKAYAMAFSPDNAYLAVVEGRAPSRKGEYKVLAVYGVTEPIATDVATFYPLEPVSVWLGGWVK